MKKIKDKSKMYMILGISFLVLAVLGSTYAYYKYVIATINVDTITRGLDYYINYTKGTDIYVSDKLYNLPTEQSVVYLLHELVHALSNTAKFNGLVQLNNSLWKLILKNIEKNNINKFLTGKDQDIHSSFKDEIVSYLMNNSLQWEMVDSNFKKEFINIVFSSGIFNLESSFWKKRFPKL